jgi:hypothetical protein
VYRLLNPFGFAAGQLAIFQGASEAPISGSIRAERATRKNSQLAAAQRVGLKMGRRLRCSSVTYPFRYAPSSRSLSFRRRFFGRIRRFVPIWHRKTSELNDMTNVVVPDQVLPYSSRCVAVAFAYDRVFEAELRESLKSIASKNCTVGLDGDRCLTENHLRKDFVAITGILRSTRFVPNTKATATLQEKYGRIRQRRARLFV